MIQAIRAAVEKVDPNLPVVRLTSESDLVAGRFGQQHSFAMA